MTSTRVAKGVSDADVSRLRVENDDDDTFFVFIENALVPSSEEDGKYSRKDVVLDTRVGKIIKITEAFNASKLEQALTEEYGSSRIEKIDGTEKMITPGLVNGHTHSVEHWLRGAIPPLPLEMWLFQLVFNEPRGAPGGWFKEKSWMETPAAMVAISALLCGISPR